MRRCLECWERAWTMDQHFSRHTLQVLMGSNILATSRLSILSIQPGETCRGKAKGKIVAIFTPVLVSWSSTVPCLALPSQKSLLFNVGLLHSRNSCLAATQYQEIAAWKYELVAWACGKSVSGFFLLQGSRKKLASEMRVRRGMK